MVHGRSTRAHQSPSECGDFGAHAVGPRLPALAWRTDKQAATGAKNRLFCPPLPMTEPSATPDNRASSLSVVEEQLSVGKREVDSGVAVRVRKQVQEVPVQVSTPVVHHKVDIRRVPIGQVVDAPPPARHEGEVLVIPVTEERVLTRTEWFLVEEIHVSPRRDVEPGQTPVTLRRERVVVERFDPASQQWHIEDA